MTAISHDGLFIGSEEYEITNCTDRIRFDPEDHAIKARLYSTANSKGFFCDYEVASGRLRLRSLCTYNSEGDYPPLNGVEVQPPKSKYDVAVWEDVGLEMDYTGALVICDCREDNDLLGYYNHMGHQPVFMHKRARCVTFCGGVLVDDFDVSDIVDKVRSMYDAAENDEEARRLRMLCCWCLGFMKFAEGTRREAVDGYYRGRYEAEQEVLSRALEGRPLGDTGKILYGVYELVPYAPIGSGPKEIDVRLLRREIEKLAAGEVLGDSAWAIERALRSIAEGHEHFRADASREDIERLCDEMHATSVEIENMYPGPSHEQACLLRDAFNTAFPGGAR